MRKIVALVLLITLVTNLSACSANNPHNHPSNSLGGSATTVPSQSSSSTGFHIENGYIVGYGSFSSALQFFDESYIADEIVGYYYEDEAIELYYDISKHTADSMRDIEDWECVASVQDLLDIWGYGVMWDYVYGSYEERDVRSWYH